MSRRTALAIIGIVVLAAVLLAVLVKRRQGGPVAGVEQTARVTATGTPRVLTLYFPDGERLVAEERRVPGDLRGPDLARRILDELLGGPTDESLFRPLPEGTAVDFVQPAEGGTLWVSFAPPEGERPPRYGSRQEILAAYSLVDTLCANLPDVDRVAFLWNGVEPVTFAGHVDTRHPLVPDPAWIRSSDSG